MSGVATIDRAQIMCAAGHGQLAGSLARWVQRHFGQLPPAFVDVDGARSRKPIRPCHAHQHSGLGLPAQVAGGYIHRCLCGNALRARRSHRQHEHCQRHTQSCNQLKPQTAAVHASHVHLLQISRRIAQHQIAYRPFCLSVEDYCIRPGRGGANRHPPFRP